MRPPSYPVTVIATVPALMTPKKQGECLPPSAPLDYTGPPLFPLLDDVDDGEELNV